MAGTNVRVDNGLYKRLKEIHKKTRVSIQGQVALALEEKFAREDFKRVAYSQTYARAYPLIKSEPGPTPCLLQL